MENLVVLIVKKDGEYLSVFYSDRSHKIIKDDIKKYRIKVKNRYKTPIILNHCYLYPTRGMNNADCTWVNIDKFIEKDEYYHFLLRKLELYPVVKGMCFKQKF